MSHTNWMPLFLSSAFSVLLIRGLAGQMMVQAYAPPRGFLLVPICICTSYMVVALLLKKTQLKTLVGFFECLYNPAPLKKILYRVNLIQDITWNKIKQPSWRRSGYGKPAVSKTTSMFVGGGSAHYICGAKETVLKSTGQLNISMRTIRQMLNS